MSASCRYGKSASSLLSASELALAANAPTVKDQWLYADGIREQIRRVTNGSDQRHFQQILKAYEESQGKKLEPSGSSTRDVPPALYELDRAELNEVGDSLNLLQAECERLGSGPRVPRLMSSASTPPTEMSIIARVSCTRVTGISKGCSIDLRQTAQEAIAKLIEKSPASILIDQACQEDSSLTKDPSAWALCVTGRLSDLIVGETPLYTIPAIIQAPLRERLSLSLLPVSDSNIPCDTPFPLPGSGTFTTHALSVLNNFEFALQFARPYRLASFAAEHGAQPSLLVDSVFLTTVSCVTHVNVFNAAATQFYIALTLTYGRAALTPTVTTHMVSCLPVPPIEAVYTTTESNEAAGPENAIAMYYDQRVQKRRASSLSRVSDLRHYTSALQTMIDSSADVLLPVGEPVEAPLTKAQRIECEVDFGLAVAAIVPNYSEVLQHHSASESASMLDDFMDRESVMLEDEFGEVTTITAKKATFTPSNKVCVLNEGISFALGVNSLPPETLIHTELRSVGPKGETECIGWAAIPVFDEYGMLLSGHVAVPLVPDSQERLIGGIPTSGTLTRPGACPVLHLQFQERDVFSCEPPYDPSQLGQEPNDSIVSECVGRLGPCAVTEPATEAVDTRPWVDETQDIVQLASTLFPGGHQLRAFRDRILAIRDAVASDPENQAFFKTDDKKRAKGRAPEFKKLNELIAHYDILTLLENPQRELVWKWRYLLTKRPDALPIVLVSCPWTSPLARQEMRVLLSIWEPFPEPSFALGLLTSQFPDTQLRILALSQLDKLSDADVRALVLQIVQAAKIDVCGSGPTVSWILRRALHSPYIVGHDLYWQCTTDLTQPVFRKRAGTIRHAFLRGFGRETPQIHRYFGDQHNVVQVLGAAALAVRNTPKESRTAAGAQYLRDHVREIPRRFTLPTSPYHCVQELCLTDLKVMDSKKAPIRIQFSNADPNGSPIGIFFKNGDDLRQDQLVLQLFSVMDRFWRQSGLDLHMSLYGCTATSPNDGMLERVQPAETTANISYGQTGSAVKGAFGTDAILKWIQGHNPTPPLLETAIANFTSSLAGYCVATYVLGLGDRHNDNVMIKHNGSIFHIDFGWFMGNFKKKLGINRDRAPFVFTPDFAFVLGGKKGKGYKEFQDMACTAFNVLRSNSFFLLSVLSLCMTAGLTQLSSWKHVEWFKGRLELSLSQEKAASRFKDLIQLSLECRTTQINNMFHLVVHQSGKSKQSSIALWSLPRVQTSTLDSY